MIKELENRHLIGVYRAIRGMPGTVAQKRSLSQTGVGLRYYSRDLNAPDIIDKIDKDFRYETDVLVTPFLGVLGPKRTELLAIVGAVAGNLYDIRLGRFFTLKEAQDRKIIEDACKVAQSAPGRASIKNPGRSSPYSESQLEEMGIAWASLEGTNSEVADRFETTEALMWKKFGGRKQAQRKALVK